MYGKRTLSVRVSYTRTCISYIRVSYTGSRIFDIYIYAYLIRVRVLDISTRILYGYAFLIYTDRTNKNYKIISVRVFGI